MADTKLSVPQQTSNKSNTQVLIISIIVSLFLAVIISICTTYLLTPRIAYVETSRLMVGFSEAASVEKEFKAEDERWRAEMKTLEDSVKVQVDRMTKEYDRATSARKKELQDLLSAANTKVNNFKQVNLRRMQELNQEKTASVVRKMNVYMEEYGKKHKYDIIFATANGSIIYGSGKRFDITDRIIKGLNERYK